MGRDARLEKIIVYVQLNQGCLTEEAFKGVRNDMSRGTFFKYLEELVKAKEIRVEYPNKRDRRLYPYNDLLKSVPEELDEFNRNLRILLDKGQKHIETLKNSRSAKANELIKSRTIKLLRYTTVIFLDIVTLYNCHALFIWTSYIKEPEVLNNLYLTVLAKANDIRDLIITKYRDLLPDHANEIRDFVNLWTMPDAIDIDKPRKDSLIYRMNMDLSEMDLKNEFAPIKNYLKGLTKYMDE
jgi:hypothetical protein